ncbi:MAG: tRNA pseudouridine(55) synthase TruB [Gammaproteobacteria bacterium]|nr:tRNA pseudouridine(55) synthase TruB [Gammaproteobacteria bacterium]
MSRRKPRGRNVNGILLLDKAIGITSNTALQKVKRLYQASKAGHTGSLDPLASGLLPLCLGEATKLSSFLLDADKAYAGVCKLGVKTSTADAEGEVIETRPVPALDEAQLRDVLAKFVGEIEQIPPMHSAIKMQGQPLYKLAHQGIEVERQPRQVTIHSLRLTRFEGDEFAFDLHCSKGTYVRTLAEDIGEILGCGAHLSALRRTQVGPFELSHAVTLEQLEQTAAETGMAGLDKLLIPMDQALDQWPAVHLSDNSAYYVRQGQAVQVAKAPTSGWVRLFASNDDFLGVGQILEDGRVAPKRLVNTR